MVKRPFIIVAAGLLAATVAYAAITLSGITQGQYLYVWSDWPTVNGWEPALNGAPQTAWFRLTPGMAPTPVPTNEWPPGRVTPGQQVYRQLLHGPAQFGAVMSLRSFANVGGQVVFSDMSEQIPAADIVTATPTPQPPPDTPVPAATSTPTSKPRPTPPTLL